MPTKSPTKSPPKPVYTTREEWLNAAVQLLLPVFQSIGYLVPPIRVSCGWPSVGATRKKNTRVGECWVTKAAEDGVNHIFISPMLDNPIDDDGHGVLETLVHEMCHAVDDCESGHKGAFRKVATAVGLQGKMTATHAGEELLATLRDVTEQLGQYPHAKVNINAREKKQSTRMVKLQCPDDGYLVRTTRKWIEVGLPMCPCGVEMEEEEGKEGEEGEGGRRGAGVAGAV